MNQGSCLGFGGAALTVIFHCIYSSNSGSGLLKSLFMSLNRSDNKPNFLAILASLSAVFSSCLASASAIDASTSAKNSSSVSFCRSSSIILCKSITTNLSGMSISRAFCYQHFHYIQNSHRIQFLLSAGFMISAFRTAAGVLSGWLRYRRLGYMKNGSVYDIDRGVEPDYPITAIDRFFDRNGLTQYINGLY